MLLDVRLINGLDRLVSRRILSVGSVGLVTNRLSSKVVNENSRSMTTFSGDLTSRSIEYRASKFSRTLF